MSSVSRTQASIRAINNQEGSAAPMLILVLTGVLTLLGVTALKVTTNDVKAAVHLGGHSKALYVAEAGIASGMISLKGRSFGSILSDTALLNELRAAISFGAGEYAVTLSDNDDGDGDTLLDSDKRIVMRSTGTLFDGTNRTIEVVLVAPTGGTVSVEAAIMSAGPVQTLGGLVVDGRDYSLLGTQVGSGTKAISTLATYSRSGNSKVAGSDDFGFEYTATKSDPGLSAVTEESVTSWDAPSGPDDVLGMDDGTLSALAKSGVNGSQYVTDPSDLTFPLTGVTYVELPCGDEWNAVDFDESDGVLVVHNDCTDAVIKNLNSGSFKGILIADDIVHIHTDIMGMIAVISPSPSSGNCIGNGTGEVRYSSEAISEALSSAAGEVMTVAWREM